jgi:ribosomal protein L11 methylase PrmA
MSLSQRLGASFRDPCGFLFWQEGVLYRQVNTAYRQAYDHLQISGLYDKLLEKGRLIPHTEAAVEPAEPALAWKVIRPEPLAFVSYPYEWSFSQLKDAALTTLAIQKRAMRHAMSLKDASAYNIQFYQGRPVLIDTLSFDLYQEGEPWVAYRQFCQHFLAPLALMAHTDVRLSQLLRVYIDGVPLDLASRLLPWQTRLDLGLSTHLHLHAAAQKRYADAAVGKPVTTRRMSQTAFQGLIDSLEATVRKLSWKAAGTEWGDYYPERSHHYSTEAFEHKQAEVSRLIERLAPGLVWDLGANTGIFSRLASQRGRPTLAFDIDPAAVEQNYLACKAAKEPNLLPLVLDLTNPSPALGWHNRERLALLERGPAELVLALALIHHLAISNNVPLPHLAEFFAQAGRWLIIEFVPKDDPQVQKLLASREDIFPAYTVEGFETAFGARFQAHEKIPIQGSPRGLYLLERK